MLAFIILTFVVAGLTKGVIGMGLPTVAVGLLGVVMAPSSAAALMVLPSAATNLWQALAGRHLKPMMRRFGALFAGIAAGTWITAWLAPAVDERLTTAGLGVILVAYVLVGRFAPSFTISPGVERRFSPWAGLATGAVSAMTGVFVMPVVPYLQRLDLDRDQLVQALGLTFLVATIALGVALPASIARMLETSSHLPLVALAAAGVGMAIGQCVRRLISPALFRACFFWGLLALGLHLASRAFL